jgi:hypothetical protein
MQPRAHAAALRIASLQPAAYSRARNDDDAFVERTCVVEGIEERVGETFEAVVEAKAEQVMVREG